MINLNFATLYEPILGPLLKNLRLEVLSLAQLKNSDTFLDCCCGAGGLLKIASSTNALYMGLDLSMNMLKQAKASSQNINFFYADASRLPYKDKSIDVTSICMALHAMPRPIAEACLTELCRVAKRVIIADYCLLERNIHAFANLGAHLVERLIGGEHYACYKSFMQAGGIEGLLYRMGHSASERRMVLRGAGQVVLLS